MCGFVLARSKNFDFIGALNKASYRGPDFQGIEFIDNFSFGHNRLSIIDLDSRSNQPFIKDNYILLYNGEIYNYKTIRKKLQKEFNSKFNTKGDTEVVLESFKNLGKDCLKLFNGMFSFVIYNTNTKQIFCAVDRLGVKPCYIKVNNDEIIVASESWNMSDKISNQNAKNFLVYGYNPAPYTIYDDVKRIPPGYYAEINSDKNNLKLTKYWSPKDFLGSKKLNYDEFSNTIINSVKLRLESDVDIACFLSGGVDSSLLASILKKELDVNLKYFTIGVKDKRYDESSRAQKIAMELGLDHEIYYFKDEEIQSKLDEYIKNMDEPLGDSSMLPTMLVCEKTSNEFKVVLSADGGDEMAMGYPKYAGVKINLNRSLRINRIIKYFNKKLVESIANFIYKGKFRSDLFIELILNDFDNEEDILSYLSRKISIRKSNLIFNDFKSSNYILNNLNFIENSQSVSDIYNYLSGNILRKVDKASMINSLELREPFLDYRLFELMLSVAENEKMSKTTMKIPLRKKLSEYLSPKIWENPKTGFSVPIDLWIRGTLNERVKNSIDVLDENNIINKNEILKLFNIMIRGDDSDVDFFWNILILGEFISKR